jgi:oxygen-independent coproporphyrinogen-3 oxidase
MYELTQQMTAEAGLPAYEVSNHARPGAESQHNLIYWRGGEYAGIGPGAHGRISRDGIRWATETHRAPTRWLDAVEQSRSGETAATRLDPVDQGEELLMMGLRIADGVSRLRVEKLIGRPLNDNVINDLASNGLLESEGDRLVATPAGRLVLNGLLRELLV